MDCRNNGYGRKPQSGTVAIRASRVRYGNQAFESRVPRAYQRQFYGIKQLIPELFLVYTLIANAWKSRRKIKIPDMPLDKQLYITIEKYADK